jgi:hypothetical protein
VRYPLLSVLLAVAEGAAAGAQPNATPPRGNASFYDPPQLSVMVGFIKDPQHTGFTVAQWKNGLGEHFDARALVSRIKASGAVTLIWYDKWIDGLVFHKTRTTTWRTDRDFLAELAPECRRQGIRLVTYFNSFYDGNPEFEKWTARDERGKVITYPRPWPEALLSVYSPYRAKVRAQIEELIRDYDVDGLWLDSVQSPSFTTDQWTGEAFAKRYGKSYQSASVDERRRFAVDTAIEWNREAAALAHRLKPSIVLTFNGLIDPLFLGPRAAAGLAESVDYFSTEMPTHQRQRQLAHILGTHLKPYEGLTMLSDQWFTPMNGEVPPATKSFAELRAELATVLSGGMNLYMSLTLSHDGKPEEAALQLLDGAGQWLRENRQYLKGAEMVQDVGIVLGTPDSGDLEWPGTGDYGPVLFKLEEHLIRSGYFPTRLLNIPNARAWKSIPAGVRTLIVPDRACLSASDAAMVEQFVLKGGRVLAFGRGIGLAHPQGAPTVHPMFSVSVAGLMPPPIWRGMKLEFGPHTLALTEPIVALRTKDSEPLAWALTAAEGVLPAVCRARAGAGTATSVAAAEKAFINNPEILGALWKEALHAPAIRLRAGGGGDASDRYTVRLRRNQSGYALHVIDNGIAQEARMGNRYHPAYVEVSIDSTAYPFQEAALAGGARVAVDAKDGWKTLTVFPAPELTVLLSSRPEPGR